VFGFDKKENLESLLKKDKAKFNIPKNYKEISNVIPNSLNLLLSKFGTEQSNLEHKKVNQELSVQAESFWTGMYDELFYKTNIKKVTSKNKLDASDAYYIGKKTSRL